MGCTDGILPIYIELRMFRRSVQLLESFHFGSLLSLLLLLLMRKWQIQTMKRSEQTT